MIRKSVKRFSDKIMPKQDTLRRELSVPGIHYVRDRPLVPGTSADIVKRSSSIGLANKAEVCDIFARSAPPAPFILMTVASSSCRGGSQSRTRNLEIPGLLSAPSDAQLRIGDDTLSRVRLSADTRS